MVNNNISKTIHSSNLLTINYLYNILMSENISEEISFNLNYLLEIIPELKNMIGFEHKHPHHHLDVWEHTLYALNVSIPNFDLRLVLLLHDIGKPFSYTEEDGIRHFDGHPKVSKEIAKKILERLEFNEDYINKISYLIEYHDTPITIKDVENNYELTYMRYLIQQCDALAHNPEKLDKRKKYLEKTKKLFSNNN